MNDLIDKQAVIDLWDKYYPYISVKAAEFDCMLRKLPSAQPEEVISHRNYQYLSDYWCECGWHLGKMGDANYCSNCGKRVKWDGRYYKQTGGN